MFSIPSVFNRLFNPQIPESTDALKKPTLPEFANTTGLKISDDSVTFLGVTLEKKHGGTAVPQLERFTKNVLREMDVRLMQKIAVAFELHQAILIESGSGIGKSETVERMCALLNWDCYYANCNDFEVDALIGGKTVREDTKSGFGWKDGIVLQAIKNGGVLFLDEYNFIRGETRGRLHEVLDAVLRGKKEIVLTENDGEVVPVHPDFRLVAAQNPPGGIYRDREILDPAQLTRFIYIKEASEMPLALKESRALGYFGLADPLSISAREYLVNSYAISKDTLKQIPELRHYINQYVEFEHGIQHLVANKTLGGTQPQPVYFAFQRDFNRIIDFIEAFYDGDLESTLKKSLYYYYENKFDAQVDRDRVRSLINCITAPEAPRSERRALSFPGAEGMPALDSEGPLFDPGDPSTPLQ